MPKRGLEPPHPCGYYTLNVARLPISPLRQGGELNAMKSGTRPQAGRRSGFFMLPLRLGSVKNQGSKSMARMFLIGRDWQSRALVRAQLLEEGVDVEAYESPLAAFNSLSCLVDLPLLILADLSQSPNPEAEIDLLSRWAKLIPSWIILAHTFEVERDLQELQIERILRRPVNVRQLVEEVKRRMDAGSQVPRIRE